MLQAGFLSRAVMKDSELSPALKVVERIHTNHFLSVPDHQLNETKSEKERERGEREREREGGGGKEEKERDLWPNFTKVENTILDGLCKR